MVAIFEIVFRHKAILRFQQIFAIWSRIACRKRSCDINWKFRKSKMADGRYEYFEIVNAPHINQKVSDFDEICCAEANSDKDDSHFTEILLFQKCFCHNSTPNKLILVKFCIMMKNHILIYVTKIAIFWKLKVDSCHFEMRYHSRPILVMPMTR